MLASSVRKTTGYIDRLRGLLGTKQLSAGDGLYIAPCQSIHMLWMTYAIDAIFLNKSGVVIGFEKSIKPWHLSGFYIKAYGCLELPEGTIEQSETVIGDQLIFKEVLFHDGLKRNA
jgi:uncharacterized membrane protein (UPF0127 family)